jgi:basic membrane protein A
MFSEDEINTLSLKRRIGEVIKQCNADTLVEVDDQAGKSLLDRSLLQLFRKPKVAFVFPYSSQINGWAKDHWRSQVAMQELYANQMTVDLVEEVLNQEDPQAVLNAAAEKYEVLFLIDCVLEEVALQSSVDYPQTTFLLCSGIKSTYLLPSYYGKTYQTNFLLGLFGAMITDEDKIGYVSGDMNQQIYRSMQAFQDGFTSIRPKAKFQYVMKEADLDEDIRFSAYYRSVVGSHLTEGTVNTYIKRRDDQVYRAYTYWNWKKFYEGMLARIMDGSFQKIRNIHNAAGNRMFFHWGMGTDVIDIEITQEMPSKSSEMIFETIKDSIIDGSLDLSYLSDMSDYETWCSRYRNI